MLQVAVTTDRWGDKHRATQEVWAVTNEYTSQVPNLYEINQIIPHNAAERAIW